MVQWFCWDMALTEIVRDAYNISFKPRTEQLELERWFTKQ